MHRLIVDGYNLVHSVPRYGAIAARSIDAAREQLIADLGARVAEGQAVTVVFDGGSNPASDGTPQLVGGVTVIFSPSGTEADAVIESLAAAARASGDETQIVTSDGATRTTAMGGAVTVMRSTTFARELATDEADWRDAHGRPARPRVVADRIDPETRDRLDRMAGRKHRPSE